MSATDQMHLDAIEEAVQRLRARLVVAEPLAQGWADDTIEEIRSLLREVNRDLMGWVRLYHEIMVEAEGAESVLALERGVIMVPVAVELLPDIATGRWLACRHIRLVACADGVFDLQITTEDHPDAGEQREAA